MSAAAPPLPDSRRSWLLLGALVAGYMGVYLCRKNLSVAVPLLRAEFHSTKEEVGRVASAGTLAYALGKMLLCPLVDRWGGRRGFLLALASVAGFGLLGGFAPTLGALAVIYALNRFGAAAAWASMIKQIPPWFGGKNQAFALAVLSLSYVFGGAAAVAFAGQVAEWSGQSWRAILSAPAFVLLALLGACVWLLPRDPAALAPEAGTRDGFSWGLARELAGSASFWIICALSFTLTLLRETFNDWTVDFIKTEGGAALSTRIAAFLSTPFDLCGAAGILVVGMLIGRASARVRSRLLAGSLVLLVAALLALPRLVPLGLGAIVPTVGVIGFLSLGPYSLLGGYFAVQLRGPRCAATVAGIVDSVGYFAGILAGSAFGWLLDRGGYTLGFHALAAISLVSAVLAFFLKLEPPSDSNA
jgi:sugar phosphate permease